MPREYGLIPESEITQGIAAKFRVVTNFPTQIVFASYIVTDASGQEIEVVTDSVACRWLESEEGTPFTTEQNTIIDTAKSKFNQGRGNKPKLPDVIKGNSEFAKNFNRGNKLKPKAIGNV